MRSSTFAKKSGPFTLSEIEQHSGATIFSAHTALSSFLIHDIASLSEACETDLSLLHQKKYINALRKSRAGACIVAPNDVQHAPAGMLLLIHDNPYKAYALISQAFYPAEVDESYISGSANISKSAILGEGCRIEHGAYIGKNVVIGHYCKIGVNSYIGDGVIIGNDCQIENNVSISHTIMGNNVLVYPGARIGQDGFGFASDEQGHYKIPHRGGVSIGNDVEIGANTCIDRGSLKNTVIEDLCRIDNLVQVGHNVKIGRGSIVVAQVGLAGSTELGEFVTISGQVGVVGHAKVGRGATILAQSLVIRDVEPGARMGGYPVMPAREWHKQTICLQKRNKKL